MKVLVAAKRVVDYNVNIRVLSDHTGVDLNNVKMSVNPFDEIAIEEAVRLKEAGKVEEVIVVSVGTSSCGEQIRTALALGADRGILVETDEDMQPLAIAKVLKAIVDRLELCPDGECPDVDVIVADFVELKARVKILYADRYSLRGCGCSVLDAIIGDLEVVMVRADDIIRGFDDQN